MFVAHYAMTEAPAYLAGDAHLHSVALGVAHTAERQLRTTEDFRHGVAASDDLVLLVLTPSVADSSRAPGGEHLVNVIGFHPYTLREGSEHWDEIRVGSAMSLADGPPR